MADGVVSSGVGGSAESADPQIDPRRSRPLPQEQQVRVPGRDVVCERFDVARRVVEASVKTDGGGQTTTPAGPPPEGVIACPAGSAGRVVAHLAGRGEHQERRVGAARAHGHADLVLGEAQRVQAQVAGDLVDEVVDLILHAGENGRLQLGLDLAVDELLDRSSTHRP